MIIQNNFDVPNTTPGYWLAGKVKTSSVDSSFQIVIKTNRDLKTYLMILFETNNTYNEVNFNDTNMVFNSTTKEFVITATLINTNDEEYPWSIYPTTNIIVDYLIFVNHNKFVSDTEYYSEPPIVGIVESPNTGRSPVSKSFNSSDVDYPKQFRINQLNQDNRNNPACANSVMFCNMWHQRQIHRAPQDAVVLIEGGKKSLRGYYIFFTNAFGVSTCPGIGSFSSSSYGEYDSNNYGIFYDPDWPDIKNNVIIRPLALDKIIQGDRNDNITSYLAYLFPKDMRTNNSTVTENALNLKFKI